MAEYRLQAVDKEGHSVGPLFIVSCDNDEGAMDRARKLKKANAVQVWQAERLVAKID